jgi:hypothetical protein
MLQRDHYKIAQHLENRSIALLEDIIYSELKLIDFVKNPNNFNESNLDLKTLRESQQAKSIEAVILFQTMFDSLIKTALHFNDKQELFKESLEVRYNALVPNSLHQDEFKKYLQLHELYYQTIFDPSIICKPGIHDNLNYLESYSMIKLGWVSYCELKKGLDLSCNYKSWEDLCAKFNIPTNETELINLIATH